MSAFRCIGNQQWQLHLTSCNTLLSAAEGHSKIQAIAAVDGWDGKWPVCMGQLDRLDWRVHRASLAECMCGRQACVFDLSGQLKGCSLL